MHLLLKIQDDPQPFSHFIALDAYVKPISEAKNWKIHWNHEFPPRIFFINYEGFQSEENVEMLKHFQHRLTSLDGQNELFKDNMVTLKNANHLVPVDLLMIIFGIWRPLRFLGNFLSPSQDWDLSCDLMQSYLEAMNYNKIEAVKETLERYDKCLYIGTDFKM